MNPTFRSFFRTTRFDALGLGLAMLLSACSSGGGGGGGGATGSDRPIQRMLRAVRDCGLSTDGRFPSVSPTFEDDCFIQCIVAHSNCDDLAAFVCDGTSRFDGACDDVCSQDIECADGDTIPMDYLCDGEEDCSFGEDENDCGDYRFRCEDGSTIDKSSQCDGEDDCGFGEDEAGCPTFRCGNGLLILDRARCDGYDDCSGGEDEAGCAAAICPG
ncbi:MAG: hypothetical protein GXP55_01120 [Deltaproteobacteria bacterium]|nr:hypothetical protein [Deltaproteobacteria bacterium]